MAYFLYCLLVNLVESDAVTTSETGGEVGFKVVRRNELASRHLHC